MKTCLMSSPRYTILPSSTARVRTGAHSIARFFTHSNEQALAPRARIAELSASGTYRQPVVTQVIPATNFWKAEEYHQRYLEKRGMVSCHI